MVKYRTVHCRFEAIVLERKSCGVSSNDLEVGKPLLEKSALGYALVKGDDSASSNREELTQFAAPATYI